MVKPKRFITILYTLVFMMLWTGNVQAMPDTMKVETDGFHVISYNINQAIEQGTDMAFDQVASVGSDGNVIIKPLVASGGDDQQAKEVLDAFKPFYRYGYNVLTSAYVEHQSIPSTPILDKDKLSGAGVGFILMLMPTTGSPRKSARPKPQAI